MGKIEDQVVALLADHEFGIAKSNKDNFDNDFESYVDLLDNVRGEKEYDWMSDIRIPEFTSHMITQAAIDVDQYFASRDFVEAYLEDEGGEAPAAASTELINRTLNQKHLRHYSKFVRAKMLNNISGLVYGRCWWEKETVEEQVDVKITEIELDVDILGNPIIEGSNQTPATRIKETPVMGQVPVKDRFNYDIIDPRNVFTDNKYVYSLQEKDYVYLRFEKSLEELRLQGDIMEYNQKVLDELKDVNFDSETDTSRESYNKEQPQQKIEKNFNRRVDVLERYGKWWCIVEEKDDEGRPTKVKPGIDEDGKKMDKAVFLELVITFIVGSNAKARRMLGFRLQRYEDADGNPYRPIIRGICYIHPTDDGGFGDGKGSRELQTAIDDTFNASQDRTLMTAFPTLQGPTNAVTDNTEIYLAPGHVIPTDEELKEFKISSDTSGALNQLGLLTSKMQQYTAISPVTLGGVPAEASTTATAVAGATQQTNIRTNYKSMTFEYTFLTEMYWMIQHMTWQFAAPETGVVLMGDKVFDFNPALDFFYKPVSQSIETEQSKNAKIQLWNQTLGYILNAQHPDTPKLINAILERIFKLMGDEFVNFGNELLNPEIPMQQAGADQQEALNAPVSNQAGIEQSLPEQGARGAI